MAGLSALVNIGGMMGGSGGSNSNIALDTLLYLALKKEAGRCILARADARSDAFKRRA